VTLRFNYTYNLTY